MFWRRCKLLIQTQLIIIFVLVMISAFFSASESALLSLSRFKVRYIVEKKKFGAIYVKKLKDDPEKLLSTVLIGNNIVSIGASALATSLALSMFQSHGIAIATGAMTFILLVFGEITPKSLATRNNESFSLFSARIIWWLSIGLYPIIHILDIFLNIINGLIGSKNISIITKEELKSILKASEEEGTIKDIEKKMVQRIFDFGNTTVSDVMTPKKNMVSVAADILVKDVLHLPTAKMYSRYPVYDKNKDNIVGILYLKDILKLVKENKLDVQVRQVMKKPFFVFSNRKMDSMLKLFQSKKEHLAVVIDDKAHVTGIVTIENILEEIVGEIIDESDKIAPSIIQVSKNEWVTKGSTDIAEINLKVGIIIRESDYDTLDSFIASSLGRPPKQGDETSYQNVKMMIEDVQGKKVLSVRIVKV